MAFSSSAFGFWRQLPWIERLTLFLLRLRCQLGIGLVLLSVMILLFLILALGLLGKRIYNGTTVAQGVVLDSLRLENLQSVCSRNINHAARELGIGVADLKRQCQKLGFRRWPQRKLKCINNLIQHVKDDAVDFSNEEAQERLAELNVLERQVLARREEPLPEWARRLRQHLSKERYKTKREKLTAKRCELDASAKQL